jgi:tetratricopeptide (TPR) repeat protein
VLERLEPAFDTRILREDAEDVGTFHFTHPTIRETIYGEMPRGLRLRLHHKAAATLARAHADDPTPRLTELARHYYEAAAGGCAAEAVHYGRLAAERAYAATAFEESVVHYRRALRALELTEPLDERTRCTLLLGLGQSMRGAGAQVAEVRKVLADAADCAKRTGDTRLLCEAAMRHAGRGPLRVQVLRELGTLDRAEIELLEQALERLGAGNSGDHALTMAWLAVSLYYSERHEERDLRSSEAVAIARKVGDPAVLAECLMLRQYSVRGPNELDSRITTLNETIELAGRIGARGLQLDAHSERAWARCERGDLNQAEADMLAVERLADELRQPLEKRMAQLWRARRLDADGRFEEAARMLQVIWGATAADQVNQGKIVHDLARHYFHGRAEEGLALLESTVARFPLVVGWRCGLSASYAEAGRMVHARQELERIAEDDFACILDDHAWVSSFTRLATAAAMLGDTQRCAAIYDKLAPYADRVCLIGHYGLIRGFVHRSLGELSTTMRDFARGEEHLERAIDLNTLAGMSLWAAFSRLSYAALLLDRDARGDRKEAFRQLSAALSYGRTRDVPVLVQQAEALSARLGEQKSLRGRA